MARCASEASLCSTIAVTAPDAASRTIRPYPVASGTSAVSTVTALPSAECVAARALRVSPVSSGVSPHDDDDGPVDARRRAPPAPSVRRARCRSARACTAVRTSASVLGEMRGDLLPGVAHDHDEVLGVQLAGGGEHMPDEGAAADLVQDLGCGRLHTGALTRCENDDGCRANGAHGMPFGCGGGGVTSAGYRGVSWGT